MSDGSKIEIRREELFAPAVEEALARERAMRRRFEPAVREVSTLRRVLLSGLYYYPAAGFLASFLVWMLLEPSIQDIDRVGGAITLVNRSPFAVGSDVVAITVGSKEVLLGKETRLERGANGQPGFTSLGALERGAIVEAAGVAVDRNRLAAVAIRPATADHARKTGDVEPGKLALAIYLPLTGAFLTLGLLVAEGIASRNWARLMSRAFLGTLLSVVFCFLAYIPAGIVLFVGFSILKSFAKDGQVVATTHGLSAAAFVGFAAARSIAWAAIGAGLGLGMNLVRSTKAQLRNSVIGGALGGAFGGLLFDPVERFFKTDSFFASAAMSRAIGSCAVGIAVGIFVALVERLAREAWVSVKTGPLAGKSFVLFRTPTTIGSSPRADIYLFKDAGIDAMHASIHRVGTVYEIESVGRRGETVVSGQPVRRRRLASGDQIVLGATVLEFQERAKRPPGSVS